MRCLVIKWMRRVIALAIGYMLGMIKVGAVSLVIRGGGACVWGLN